MKRSLSLLILVLISCAATSQSSRLPNDSVTCLPNSVLRNAAIWIEKGKIAAAERDACQDSVKVYQARVGLKDSIISYMRNSESQYKSIIENYKKELELSDQQKKLALDMYASERKAGRKRRFLATVKTVTIAVIATSATFFLTK